MPCGDAADGQGDQAISLFIAADGVGGHQVLTGEVAPCKSVVGADVNVGELRRAEMLQVRDESVVEGREEGTVSMFSELVGEVGGSVDRHRGLSGASCAEDNNVPFGLEGHDLALFSLSPDPPKESA